MRGPLPKGRGAQTLDRIGRAVTLPGACDLPRNPVLPADFRRDSLLGWRGSAAGRRGTGVAALRGGRAALRVQLAGKECRRSHNEEGIQLGSETVRVQFGGKPPLAKGLSSPAARRVDGYG
jgi:hypothetical protein